MIIAVVLWVLAAGAATVFVGRAWSLGSLVAKTRGQLVRSGVDAVVALALVAGSLAGAVAGFAGGLLVDVMTLGTLGVTSIVLILVGYWAGRYGETTARGRAYAPSLAAFALTLGSSALPQARSVAFASIVSTQLAQTLDVGWAEGTLTRSVFGAVVGSAAVLGVVCSRSGWLSVPPWSRRNGG